MKQRKLYPPLLYVAQVRFPNTHWTTNGASELLRINKNMKPPSSLERTLWVSKDLRSSISTSGSQRFFRMCRLMAVRLGASGACYRVKTTTFIRIFISISVEYCEEKASKVQTSRYFTFLDSDDISFISVEAYRYYFYNLLSKSVYTTCSLNYT